jgi:hypothetical protein
VERSRGVGADLIEGARAGRIPASDVMGGAGVIAQSEQPRIAGRAVPDAEQGARRALRGQIARMERELSGIVADTFPHISPISGPSGEGFPSSGPGGARRAEHTRSGGCLLTLAELERLRDSLAGQVQDLRRMAAARGEHERRAHELLRRMKLEPGRYKFVRLPVKDLGEGGCGVWEVRPRLGLVGMLAGWWQVKLSSGCPLPRGHAPAWSVTSPRACGAGDRSSIRLSSSRVSVSARGTCGSESAPSGAG